MKTPCVLFLTCLASLAGSLDSGGLSGSGSINEAAENRAFVYGKVIAIDGTSVLVESTAKEDRRRIDGKVIIIGYPVSVAVGSLAHCVGLKAGTMEYNGKQIPAVQFSRP